jgi:hypothetical protein
MKAHRPTALCVQNGTACLCISVSSPLPSTWHRVRDTIVVANHPVSVFQFVMALDAIYARNTLQFIFLT